MVDYEELFKLSVAHILQVKDALVYSDGGVLTIKFKMTNDDLPKARQWARRIENPLHLRFTGMETTPQSEWWYTVSMTFVEDNDNV